jgi:hypothetical protein
MWARKVTGEIIERDNTEKEATQYARGLKG